ncbi:MAG: hypothetical protein HZB18_07375 [Chloroflexi bacterium]|nr:hypothetical protein [Chloroflexota bacterium]
MRRKKSWGRVSTLVSILVTVMGITSVAFASGGNMFAPGNLSAASGTPLGGVVSHSQIQECASCHAAPWDADTMADRCLACHSDITQQLSQPASLHNLIKFSQPDMNCRACHTEHHGPTSSLTQMPPGWNPHDQLGFSLKTHRLRMDGTLFECTDCHANGFSQPIDQLVCANCHLQVDYAFAQEHILTFWTDCTACHDGLDSHGSTFDHNQVEFPLVGLHTLSKCSGCHINARNLNDLKITPQDCYACHQKEDWHNGQFGTLCGICHTPQGWRKSAQFDHSLSNFKLIGKHTSVACDVCHVNRIYKGIPSDCYSCHAKDDKHNGSLGFECAACHTPEGWNRAIDHSQFAFKLDGQHTNVACESCHQNGVFAGTPMNCAACHNDAHAGKLGTQCESCHTVNGWSPAAFDHNTVRFSLAAHQTKSDGAAFACKDCHAKGYTPPFDQLACANCHLQVEPIFAQEHILTFWTDCMACHDGLDSHGSSFNHNLVLFPLAGQHAQASCSGCHVNAHNLNDLKAAPQDCYTCHQKDDFHKGQFGTTCASCHTPNGWKPANVDHSQFPFKLDGKHTAVACASCHQNGIFKETPTDCASCHLKNDAHAGRLGAQCGTCHTSNGWTPASFDHNTIGFSLNAHQTKTDGTPFACQDCHAQGYAAPMDQAVCGNCHLGIDQTFATQHFITFGTNCTACHDGLDTHGSNFDHNRVPFNLVGKHGQAACSSCHVAARSINDLKSTPQNCYACHAKDDKHNGQFGTSCATCHTPEGWNLATVDHSQFAFRLDGKHASVSCENCHQGGVFKGTPMDCASCHSRNDPHAGALGSQCQSCHTTAGWTPSTFDHNRSAFFLTGKHATVNCYSCHTNKTFKGTPSDCASCHAGNDDPHAGKLGTQCQSCHTPNGWTPSTFDHSRSSFLLTGKHSVVNCYACHANKLFKGTPSDCASCHSKNDPHGGSLGNSCSACHTTSGWKPSSFDHSRSAFPLTGSHTSVNCSKCHINQVFKGTPTNCYACHAKNDRHGGKYGTNCAACHTTTSWKSVTFDHNRSAFPLTGAHINTSCTACHKNGVYSGTPSACSSCHGDPAFHAGEFGTNCSSCHTTTKWRPATFNQSHPSIADEGGSGVNHGGTTCKTCHTSTVFKATCTACHDSNNPGDGDDDDDD